MVLLIPELVLQLVDSVPVFSLNVGSNVDGIGGNVFRFIVTGVLLEIGRANPLGQVRLPVDVPFELLTLGVFVDGVFLGSLAHLVVVRLELDGHMAVTCDRVIDIYAQGSDCI